VPGSSQVYDLLNAGDFEGAAKMITSMTWGHEVRKGKRVRVFYRGLVSRRAGEAAPFSNAANAPLRTAAK
jgi:GH24 family phage-related lysozyme (muramidase)